MACSTLLKPDAPVSSVLVEKDGSFGPVLHRVLSPESSIGNVFIELVRFLSVLYANLELEASCVIKILILIERSVAHGHPLHYSNLRKTVAVAAVLASKEHYDEAMRLVDLRNALPHFALKNAREMEAEFMEKIRWHAVCSPEIWAKYHTGLQSLLHDNAPAIAALSESHSLNAILPVQ
jgi:hypothetical protein